MQTRRLGKDGPEVSAICFGAWPIGGGLGAVPEEQGIATVKAAIEVGMTFIDTAEGYQTSESVLGKALKGQRHEVFLATKLSGPEHSLEHMNRAVENSLRTLGTDYIDLYQLHSPQPQWPIEETMAGLLKLREQGKIRYIGVSNFSAEQTLEAMKHGPVHSSQPRYNMIWREAEESILSCCLENGVGVIPHSVLAKGLLGGKHVPGHRFAARCLRWRQGYLRYSRYADGKRTRGRQGPTAAEGFDGCSATAESRSGGAGENGHNRGGLFQSGQDEEPA